MLILQQIALQKCYLEAQPVALDRCSITYAFLSGSRAYGTHDEDSDYDITCVFAAPQSYYLGLNLDKVPDSVELKGVEFKLDDKSCSADIRYYELNHFIRLALKCNLSVLEGLWVDDSQIIFQGSIMPSFRAARGLFISTEKIYKAYTGYAYDQMKKMSSPNASTGRMGAKRKALVEKFGYDTKNACHLIRMYYTIIDILRSQQIRVRAPEIVDELRDICSGRFTMDEVLSMATSLGKEADQLMRECEAKNHILKADGKTIERLLVHKLITLFTHT